MIDKKRGLGRGFNDLFSSTDWLKRDDLQLFFCPVEKLTPNPYQPRQTIDDAGLEELVHSIREKGVIQPIIVTAAENGESYVVLAGERRWRAACRAGLTEIPVVIREATPAEALELALIENIQRRDLNCIEEAMAYKRLQEEFELTQEDIAQRVGKKRSTVANLLRIIQLPMGVQKRVLDGELSMGHARALAGVDDPEIQERLASQIAAKQLSVRKAEELAACAQNPQPVELPPTDPETESLTARIRTRLGLRVTVRQKSGKGKISIGFDSPEELQGLLNLLGIEP